MKKGKNGPMITKDVMIQEVLQLYPKKTKKLAQIMIEAGLHCVGCGAATLETLEEGTLGHGMGEDELKELIVKLNEEIQSQ